MHGGTIVGTLDRAEATQEAILELALGPSRPAAGWPHERGPAVPPRAVGGRGLRARAPASWRSRPRRSSGRATSAGVAVSNAPVLVAAVGMTLVILCRQIDISIGSQFSICGVVAGLAGAGRGCRCRSSALGDAAGRGGAWGRSTALLVAGLGAAVDRGDAGHAGDRPRVAPLPPRGGVRPRPAGAASSGSAPGRRAGQWLVVAIALVRLRGVRLGPAAPGGRPRRLRDGLGPRGRAAGGHPAAAGRLRRLRRDGRPGGPGRAAQRRPVRRRRPQRRHAGWSCR